MSNEESAAWLKLKRAGKKVIYSPHAIVFHHIDKRRVNAQWLSRRIAWQAVSDAISDPEYALYVANKGAKFDTMRMLFGIKMRFLRSSQRQRSLSTADAQVLYRLVLALLCFGFGDPSL